MQPARRSMLAMRSMISKSDKQALLSVKHIPCIRDFWHGQHVVGMSGAKYIVAVNTDDRAPIFEHCDYGIVADWGVRGG